jgi:surface polysaccharide O-acyltransferase-like enzyme
MVVLLHVAAPYHYQLNEISMERWIVVNLYDSIVRPCVPLFFMASGFLLLRFDEPIVDFIIKRLNRIFVPFVFWTVAYLLWRIYYAGQLYTDFGGVWQIAFFPVSYHLWYLYAIASCYLFLPVLRKITVSDNDGVLAYYCGIWFLAVALLPLVEKYLNIKNQYDFAYASGYIGYFALGYLLGKRVYTKTHAALSITAIIICTITTEYITRLFTVANLGVLVGDFTNILSPTVIIASSAWFVLIKFLACATTSHKLKRLNKFIVSVSACSFGIYLVHVIYINIIVGEFSPGYLELTSNLTFMIPLISLAVFIASYLTILIFGKMGLLKKVVGF